MRSQLSLLKSKRFLPLFITQFCGAFNDNAFRSAVLIWLTYNITKNLAYNVNTLVTIAAGLFILPFFIFASTAGQIADRYEKSYLTQLLKIFEIVLVTLSFFCFYTQNMYGLFIILFLLGTQSTFFGPIKYSLLPTHLKDSELIAGNGLIGGGTFLAILLGTLFGSISIHAKYGIATLSGTLIAFAIIGWLSSSFIPTSPIGDRKLKINWHIISQTKNIILYAWKERIIWFCIMGISWLWFIGIILLTQLPHYTKTIIKANEYVVTLFLMTFTIGIGAGSLLCNKLLKGKINAKLVPFGAFGISIFMIDFYFASNSYSASPELFAYRNQYLDLLKVKEFFSLSIHSIRIVIDLLLVAISSGIYIVPLYAIMQHLSNYRYVSRIIAANNLLNALWMLIANICVFTLYYFNWNITEIILSIAIVNILILAALKPVYTKKDPF